MNSCPAEEMIHILSPFDPLINQRKRLQPFFDYEHRFEAYVQADRQKHKLLVQRWTWVGRGSPRPHKRLIEEELHRFELFQFA